MAEASKTVAKCFYRLPASKFVGTCLKAYLDQDDARQARAQSAPDYEAQNFAAQNHKINETAFLLALLLIQAKDGLNHDGMRAIQSGTLWRTD